jgi:hypothetical protein
MDAGFKSQLPERACDLVNQIETYCGLELCARYNANLQASDPKTFAKPSGEAVRIGRIVWARTITKFTGDQLEEIGIEYCQDPLTVQVVTHELLHLRHILVDQAITRMKYLEGLGIDDSTGGLYNVLDYIEHLFVFREMKALGLNEPVSALGLQEQMSAVWYLPAGLCRRIVGLMGWLQACFCFPNQLKTFVAARLLEIDLLDDARKLEAATGRLLKQDRMPLIIECCKLIGIPPQYVELGFYQRNNGKWRAGIIRPSRGPIGGSNPVPPS